MNEALEELLEYLEETARAVRELEAEGAEALHEHNDADEYRAKMSEKAELLGSMAEEAEPYLEEIPSSLANPIRDRLERFSESADNALDVDSVFYMSALLYPEDHQEGDRNDLEKFIGWIKEEA